MHLLPKKYIQITQLVEQIRTFSSAEDEQFNEQLKELLIQKSVDEGFKKELTEFCFFTLNNAHFVNAFADYGIHSSRGFFPEIASRIKHKILPCHLPENEFSHFISFVFSKKTDNLWVQKINYSSWEAITNLIDGNQLSTHPEKFAHQLHNAIIILSHRLTSIGIDSYLARKFPEIDDNNSPFFELNHHVSLFVKKHLGKGTEIDTEELAFVLESINRSEQLFIDLLAKKDEIGTSLHLIFLTQRAQQHIARIRLLLNLLITKRHSNKILTISQLVTELVKAEQIKNDLIKFVRDNTSLLAYRIISHTSEKGEHYIGFSKKENLKLFTSAMGGGLAVVFMVYIKNWIHGLHASLFLEGLLYGLNYAFGFVFMYLAHLTLATKQPAMTASFIADTIDKEKSSGKKPKILFKQIIRSQFLSLFGNLLIVIPLCFLSAWLIDHCFHQSIYNYTESNEYMYSNHPLLSGSLIYAAVTGVLLSISGIMIGYIDNKMIYSEIHVRLMKHPKLVMKYNVEKRKKIAAFIEKNSGAIIGNSILGLVLGMTGSIGKFIGIPFDIRHISISSGNFAIALGSDNDYQLDLIISVFVGIILIGIINIVSSFLISFIVACQSRNLSWKQSLKVLVGFSK